MRRAVIDIGTNTVKLLVAEVRDGRVTPLAAKDATTRLGEGVYEILPGGRQAQRISPAAISRTVEAVARFAAEARALGTADIIAVTTSAARDSTNRDDFLDAVRRQCGLAVQMISGEREAELIFRGVCSDPTWANQPALVMDIGGGTTEFIQGAAGKIERYHSLQLGAVRMTEQFGEARFIELGAFLRDTLRRELADYSLSNRRLIGTGGTILALAAVTSIERGALISNPRPRHRNAAPAMSPDHTTLTCDEARSLVERLRAMPLLERRSVPGLPPERADIIIAGGSVAVASMEVLGAKELTASVRSLRFGVLVEEC
jgi:exopolyphosphatase/guanosine-5'-triphosphate,3'-diphosphate pyrophosphatase